MSFVPRTLWVVTLGLILVPLATGCSSGPAKVDIRGKVVKNGEPLKVGKQGIVRVIFFPYPEVKEGKPFTSSLASVNKEDGTFEVKGIPVGKYLISVEQIDPMPINDLLKGAFNRKNSPIVRDVTSNGQEINLDLAKEGTGQ